MIIKDFFDKLFVAKFITVSIRRIFSIFFIVHSYHTPYIYTPSDFIFVANEKISYLL